RIVQQRWSNAELGAWKQIEHCRREQVCGRVTQNFEPVARLRHDWFNLHRVAVFTQRLEWSGEIHLASINFRCQSLFGQIAIELLESLSDRCRIRHRHRFTVFQLYVDLTHFHITPRCAGKTDLLQAHAGTTTPKSQGRTPFPTIYDSLIVTSVDRIR